MTSGRAAAIRYTGGTTLAVATFLLATRSLWPDPGERALAQYRMVTAFGYGHLIGAVTFASHRLRGWVPSDAPPALFWSFVVVSVAAAFAAYSLAVVHHFELVLAMLAVSLWHTVENDEAICRSLRQGRAVGPLPRDGRRQIEVLAVTFFLLALSGSLLPDRVRNAMPWQEEAAHVIALLAVLLGGAALVRWRSITGLVVAGGALALPRLLPFLGWLEFADFFSAMTLYHLFGWLCVLSQRARDHGPDASARLRYRLLVVHAPPIALCAATLLADGGWGAAVRDLLFSPGIYLFWSVLHVVQTAAVRGVEARRTWMPAGQPAA